MEYRNSIPRNGHRSPGRSEFLNVRRSAGGFILFFRRPRVSSARSVRGPRAIGERNLRLAGARLLPRSREEFLARRPFAVSLGDAAGERPERTAKEPRSAETKEERKQNNNNNNKTIYTHVCEREPRDWCVQSRFEILRDAAREAEESSCRAVSSERA